MRIRTGIAGGLVAALFVSSGARARAEGLDGAARARTIDGVLRLLDEQYVFPDVARRMARAVRDRADGGAYDDHDGPALARALTRDLRAVGHDLHLRVEYSAEPLPPEPEGAPIAPPPEAKEAMRRGLARENFGFKKVEVLEGNVGYIRLDLFAPVEFAADTYAAAMAFVAHTDALIIDLRNNGGSIDPEAVPLLCGYFFDEPVHLNDIYWRPEGETRESWSRAEVPGRKYLDRPIYLLTSRHTFSGAEEFAYDLKNLKRATLVGEATGGGANPGGTRRVDEHFSVWVPFGRAISPITGTNWEGTGVAPDVAAPSTKALVVARLAALRRLEADAADPGWKEPLRGTIAAAERQAARFRPVAFALRGHPDAREVHVAGTFNGWSDRAHPLVRHGDSWAAEIEAEPGRLAYKFVIDGEWALDPDNPETERDGPHTNSIRVVE